MVGEKVSQNVRDRVTAAKELVTSEVDLVKRGFGDVMGFLKGQEPSLPRSVNFPGRVGGLAEVPPSVVLGTLDNVSTFVRKQIEITRRWV